VTTTARGRALGSALQQARKARGITLRALGAKLGRPAGTLSNWETARHRPKPDQVSLFLSALGVTGEEYDEIVALAYDEESAPWVATSVPTLRAQLNALVQFESNAARLTDVASLLIPGLLQIGDYSRAIMRSARVPRDEIDARVTLRIGRGNILSGPNAVSYTAYLGPHAYTYVIGGLDVMSAQLRHVLDVATRPHVTIRAIRADAGWHPGLEGSFKLMEFVDAQPLVHIETRRSGLFFHEVDDIRAYDQAVARLDQIAHNEEETMALLSEKVRELERVFSKR
jgi:transcriptional regulator with XRE-family HTH domain